MPSPTGPQLHCTFLNDDPFKIKPHAETETNTVTETATATLSQDAGKKSSFILPPSPDNDYALPKPAHMILEYRVDGKPQTFYLGGFQLVSNARHVEVYLSDQEGKETYLMTSKGITFDGDYHKAVSVVPGGPRAITRLHVKLLSLRPTGETTAKLQSLKVTARCPEVASASGGETNTPTTTSSSGNKTTNPAAPHNPLQQPRSSAASVATTSNSSPPLTQSDLGAAMASMSIMGRATEDRIEQALEDRFVVMEQNLGARWTKMEQHILKLTSVVVSQKQVMMEQNGLVVKQQNKLVDQGNVIHDLMTQQTEVLQLTQTLKHNLETMHQDYQRDQKEYKQRREQGAFATVKSLQHDLDELRQKQQMEREMKELELAELQLENAKSQESNVDDVDMDDDDDVDVVQEPDVEQEVEETTEDDVDDDGEGAEADAAATEVELLSFHDEDTTPQQDGGPSSDSGLAMDVNDNVVQEPEVEPELEKTTEDDGEGAVADAAATAEVELLSSHDEDTTPQQDGEPSSDSGLAMDVNDKKSLETMDSKEEEKKDSDTATDLSEENELSKSASEDAPEGDLLGLEGDLLELGQDDQTSEA